MPLAFSASQQLTLPIADSSDRLAAYLGHEDRVVSALLDPQQLQTLAPGHYRYTVTRVQVFQLQIQPIVQLRAWQRDDRLELDALDCQLEGLGLVDDFQLRLHSWLRPCPIGLEGEASLSVSVSQPPLLKLIPAKMLEATGRSVLAGILLGIRNRVGQQLLADFQDWCGDT
ncbi:MAG: DUF1997 domain-containing protein [Cyanobium sp.]